MWPLVGKIKTVVQTPGDQMKIALILCQDIPEVVWNAFRV